MARYFEDSSYNVAFERCIDVMTKLLVKYGPSVISTNTTPVEVMCNIHETDQETTQEAA